MHLRNQCRLSMIALALLALPSLWFVRTDLGLFAGNLPVLSGRFAVRFVMVALPIAGILLLRAARAREAYTRRLFVVSMGLAAAFIAINLLRPAASGLPIRSPLAVIAVMYAALPNTFWRQTIPPLLLTAGVVWLDLTWLYLPERDPLGDIVILLALNATGVLLVRRRTALEAEVEAACAELRTLRGTIPICAHCKNVRTEVGEWQQIEQYVHDRSDAQFSHGVCPACFQRHYPDIQNGRLVRP